MFSMNELSKQNVLKGLIWVAERLCIMIVIVYFRRFNFRGYLIVLLNVMHARTQKLINFATTNILLYQGLESLLWHCIYKADHICLFFSFFSYYTVFAYSHTCTYINGKCCLVLSHRIFYLITNLLFTLPQQYIMFVWCNIVRWYILANISFLKDIS